MFHHFQAAGRCDISQASLEITLDQWMVFFEASLKDTVPCPAHWKRNNMQLLYIVWCIFCEVPKLDDQYSGYKQVMWRQLICITWCLDLLTHRFWDVSTQAENTRADLRQRNLCLRKTGEVKPQSDGNKWRSYPSRLLSPRPLAFVANSPLFVSNMDLICFYISFLCVFVISFFICLLYVFHIYSLSFR